MLLFLVGLCQVCLLCSHPGVCIGQIQMFELSLSTGVWCVDVCVYRTQRYGVRYKNVRTRVINTCYCHLYVLKSCHFFVIFGRFGFFGFWVYMCTCKLNI